MTTDPIQDEMRERIAIARQATSPIFNDPDVLSNEYVPATLIARDNQILEVLDIFLPTFRTGAKIRNYIILGPTGCGKTVVTRYVLRFVIDEIAKEAETAPPDKPTIHPIYVLCRDNRTKIAILISIIASLDPKSKFVNRGIRHDEYVVEVVRLINRLNVSLVVLFDEIDQVDPTEMSDILYMFSRIQVNYQLTRGNYIAVIGITNRPKFQETIDIPTLSSFKTSLITFPGYSAPELIEILSNRVELAFQPNAVSQEILAHCAAWGAQESGDCRYALDLIWVAGMIAEQRGATAIDLEMLEEAKDRTEVNSTLALIDKFALQLKLVVYAITLLEEAYPLGKHTSGNIYRVYNELCVFRATQSVTPRRLSDMLKELDYYQIITTAIANRGRYGRTKEVILNLETNKIKKLLQSQIDAENEIRAKPFCQKAVGNSQKTL